MNDPHEFTHRFLPAPNGAISSTPTLVLLHGTGGDENDLLELGEQVAPDCHRLSPRGKILENGMARFFRRFGDGVFDEMDVQRRTYELADFVRTASRNYGFSADTLTALGYSNGANIAASLLLLRPGLLRRAVLLRAMVPLIPKHLPDLTGVHVYLSSGLTDTILPIESARRLAKMLRDAGADVTHRELDTGHQLTSKELEDVRDWLAATPVSPKH